MTPILALIIPIIFFMLMTLVFSQGASANNYSPMQTQLNTLNCPMPEQNGLWNNTGTIMHTNGTYNYKAKSVKILTLSCSKVHTLDNVDYYYGDLGGFGVPVGSLFYVGDWLSVGVEKLGALGTMIGLAVVPPSQIPSSVATTLFLFIYVPMYCLLAFGSYKVLNPISG